MPTLSDEAARSELNYKLQRIRDFATPKQVESLRIMGVSAAHLGRAELLGALCMVMSMNGLIQTKDRD